MDNLDRAQQFEEMERNRALSKRTKTTGVSSIFCEDCEQPILEARRNAIPGVTRCISCQQEAELRAKRYA